jgi:glycosidase
MLTKINSFLLLLIFCCFNSNAQNAWGVLASPFQLQVDTSKLIIADYFPFNSKIDSVQIPQGLKKISLTDHELLMVGTPKQTVAHIRFFINKEKYDIPCFAPDKENISLSIQLEKPARTLEIKGTFTSWAPQAKGVEVLGTLPSKTWKIELQKINTGKHQYKLIADGVEVNPLNSNIVSNGIGGTNVSLEVGNNTGVLPKIETSEFEGTNIHINATNIEGYLVFWNHRLISSGLKKVKKISFEIPADASKQKRSYIRVYGYGAGKISNDILIPLENGKVVNSTSLLDRKDLHTQIMYFIMVDRFVDGDKNNNPAKLESVNEKADFYGGDITGIQKKIDEGFFEDLGLNTIWLSPIAKNPDGAWGYWDKEITTKFSAYHGYWPTSYSIVDKRFGTNEGFSKLITKAHQKEMNVVLDFVAHHIHTDHPLYKTNPTWVTPLYLPDGSMNTERWDDHRLTTWFDTFLPTIDFQRNEVNEIISDSVMYWVRNFDIDGFRHDASKHVPEQFWRTLTRKIRNDVKENNKSGFYQIGETYGSPELIGSYVNSGQMDGQFDFNMYDAGLNAFAFDADKEESVKKFKRLSETIQESFKYYGTHHLMGNISGNQDKPRFSSLAEGTIKPDEDTKLAGWTRDIQHQGTKGYARMAQMMALNFTLPGVPVVYYGDEIAMPGGNDPDNRRMMKFENYTLEEIELRDKVRTLANLRKNNLEFLYGDFKEVKCTEGFYAYERNYFGKKTLIVFSKNAGKVNIVKDLNRNVKAYFTHPFQLMPTEIILELKSDDFEIFTYE